ncbi:MAG: ABC transporter ATP-binding protein [Bacilli bacterium]|nr:ABC transporter ATP-binding protein [Bacilli bacterium]
MEIIKCVDVVKNYTNKKITTYVLKNINIIINRGEFCAVTGPSGSGKTTLLYVMSGLEKCTSGSVEIFKKPLSLFSSKETAEIRKRRIGFVFQFYNLLPNLTVYENILLAKIISDNKEGDIAAALAVVGMEERKKHFPSQLSGGEQQRVALARAIINDPEIIFADEPTGNLDVAGGIVIMDLLKKLNNDYQKTIILVTHSEDNLKYCNRHIKLLDGRIIGDEKTGF